MSEQFTFNPKLDFAIERFIDTPAPLVWEALTKPEHLKEWYMPKAWGRVSRAEMDVRPGGIFSIDIATGDGHDSPNLGEAQDDEADHKCAAQECCHAVGADERVDP
ncbi:MAG TPA: SRPBCC domain-containing protein [Gemmatimonadaceae bacterium]